ncbi:hypothetical protein EDB92DRAFT_2102610 [Lactarius akahatsu]|uniref:DUF6535 domain-containing protein n=1 Tax=Lactarius akahatsu TaxID=416441 RepID=A0AAD4LJH7_9AGAM|nr:hypothetical protein EDB92DRAFT_2102610 [Lactarius akahatsu]
MPRRTRRRRDPEQRPFDSGGREKNNSSEGEYKDFDDGANALWPLYGKEAQTHDEALFQGILAEMNGVPTFAALFAAVITSFLVESLKNLQPDPAETTNALLVQISRQIASIPQVSSPLSGTEPFVPLAADISVNSFWLIGLVFSLSAALFATFVQQWIRSYLRVFQRYDHPLKRARFPQFFFRWPPGSAEFGDISY